MDDRYELLEVIGSGGMATVWRARDTRLGRLVALKRPHPAPPGSTQLTRFIREARAAATVSHPHLVPVFDVGEDDHGPYLVMDLIAGPSLADADVASDRAAEIGVQIASALSALHAAGVVHGDVKPGNILLAADGAKLTDFGIARTRDDTTRLTQAGVALGTPAYAPPEVLRGGDRTRAGDVYSLAAVLHELVTGSLPNDVAGQTRLMPPGVWAALLAPALTDDPAARPPAAEFAASLAAAIDGERARPTIPMQAPVAQSAPQPPRRRVGRTAIAVLLAGAVAIITLLAVALRDAGDEPVTAVPAATVTSTIPSTTISTTTSSPPTSEPPPTPPPAPPTSAAPADELIALIESVTPAQIKPKETRDVIERIENALEAATAGDLAEAEDQLVGAAETLDRHLESDDTRARARQLLTGLASQLGVE